MNELAPQDRPREKLERIGTYGLGDNELLALVLGHGTRACNALMLANTVLADIGERQGLATASLDQLARTKGVGRTRAGRIIAAIELGRRTLLGCPHDKRPQILSVQDAVALLSPQFSANEVEQFGVLLLDTRHRVKRTRILSTGAADGTWVCPRELFREALLAGATKVILFHNHPSGDPTPSPEDRELTQRLRTAGELMNIQVLDHLILANNRYYSFQETLPQPPPTRKRKRDP
jgi:DNA repair protein RadC